MPLARLRGSRGGVLRTRTPRGEDDAEVCAVDGELGGAFVKDGPTAFVGPIGVDMEAIS